MTTYRLDPAAFREHVLNAPWMVEAMRAKAQRGYELAAQIAPERTGEYRDSFLIASGTNGPPDSNEKDRAYAELHNFADDAPFVEFGNGHEGTAHHVLLRALDAMGG